MAAMDTEITHTSTKKRKSEEATTDDKPRKRDKESKKKRKSEEATTDDKPRKRDKESKKKKKSEETTTVADNEKPRKKDKESKKKKKKKKSEETTIVADEEKPREKDKEIVSTKNENHTENDILSSKKHTKEQDYTTKKKMDKPFKKKFGKENTKFFKPKTQGGDKSKLGQKEWKELTESRKRKRKPYYDLQKELVGLWEKMRQKNLNKEERSRLVTATLNKMKGKIPEIAGSHVWSRVLQTCVKHCQQAERDAVYEELRPHFLKLARSTYAVHLLTKMIDHETKKQLQEMISSLHGHVVTFLRHPVASAVLEQVYKLGNASQKQELVSEFYSPEYRLFKSGKGRLVELLSQENPTKKASIMQHLWLSIQPILEKGIVDHSIFHRVLLEYLTVAAQSSVGEVIEQLAGPLIVRMIHTKDGAKVAALCIIRGTAKERKKIVKGMKGHVNKIAVDEHGSVVLMCILNLVDDTSLVAKYIIRELEKNLKELAMDKYGRRILLHLLCPNTPRYFSPDILSTVSSNHVSLPHFDKVDKSQLSDDKRLSSTTGNHEDVNEAKEETGTSKKDASKRRFELLVKSGVAQKIIQMSIQNAGELLRSQIGKDTIFEVARGAAEGILWQETSENLTSLHQAIADLGALPPQNGEENQNEHVFVQYQSSRAIRKLVLECEKPENVDAPSFAKVIWDTALKGKCKLWGNGHSEKVVSAFLECLDPEVKDMAKQEIQPLIDAGLMKPLTDRNA